MAKKLKKQSSRKSSASAVRSAARAKVEPPALSGWLNAQRNLAATDPTALELARNIKRNLFAE